MPWAFVPKIARSLAGVSTTTSLGAGALTCTGAL